VALLVKHPCRVFLVEDSRNMQSALGDLLDSLGGFALAGQAFGETQATAWSEQHAQDWDLAIVDLVLENGSGFHLFQRMLRENPKGRVVVFSEYATPVLKQKCMALGAHAVFRKSELPEFTRYLESVRGSC
jgi:DNA-binding NarL/FixJ family response regulator